MLDERAAAEAEIAAARRAMAAPVPPPDIHLDDAVREAERELADALAELGALRSARQAQGQELAALRRAAATRQAERDTARRRLAEIERRAADEKAQAEAASGRRAALEADVAAARTALAAATEAERQATLARETVREMAGRTDADRAAAHERAVGASARAAAVRAQLDGLQGRLAEDEARGIARAARRLGGRRLDEDLAIDPTLREAAESALAAMTRAYVVAGRFGRLPRDGAWSAGRGGARERVRRARRRARTQVPRGARRRRWRNTRHSRSPRHDGRRAASAGSRRLAAGPRRVSRAFNRRCRRAGSSPPATGRRSSASSA